MTQPRGDADPSDSVSPPPRASARARDGDGDGDGVRDDDVLAGGLSIGRPSRWRRWAVRLAVGVAVWALLTGVLGYGAFGSAIAAALMGLLLTGGLAFLRSLAVGLPPPPEAGTLRKVKLVYRCSICGTEVRMTAATHQDPEPPRHCQEDMDLVAPID